MAELIRIICRACGQRWDYGGPVSDYGRQALESRACPGCGSCTLTAVEPSGSQKVRHARRRDDRGRN